MSIAEPPEPNRTTSVPAAADSQGSPADGGAPPQDGLPASLRSRLNGDLGSETPLAWAHYDLDAEHRYADQWAVLTEKRLVLLEQGGARTIALTDLKEARVDEGLGVDRLLLLSGDDVVATLRYSRRHRRDMTRLQRRISRRVGDKKDAQESETSWLEALEQKAQQSDLCRKCGGVIPAYADGVCPQCLAQKKVLWRLLDVAKPYRKLVWISLAVTLVHTGINVAPPVLNKLLIDRAINPVEGLVLTPSQRLGELVFWGVAIVLTIIASEALGGVRMQMLSTIGTSVARDLRHQVYSHMHALSLRFFSKRRTGSLITRVTSDTDRLWDFIVFGSVNFLRDVLMILAIAIVMFWMSWKLALVALMPIPAVATLTYIRGMKMQSMFGRLWTYWSRITGVVGDALPGVRVVKAFANEPREIDRFDRRNSEYTVREQEVNKVFWTLQPMVSGLMRLGGISIWIVGGVLIIRGSTDITFGTLVAFSGFVWQFYQPIMELAGSSRMVTRAATSAARVFEVLDTPPDIFDRKGAHKPEHIKGRVEFKRVSFSYEGAQPALREVDLTIEPGEMIGLCGHSGAGKSTFVNLIPRFYDVTDGQLLIDGVDVRDYDLATLRRSIGMVLQEPYLFHGTIADNIRYGNPSASDREVIEAARAANAHDFIVGFPDGYDTVVGERGQSLSGGERQRVSIARAILHNPRILILDEATSSVDTETEKQIQQALDRLVEGRTTIAIAHRLSTLTAADRLVVLDKGRIAETGSHDELISKEGGIYAKLHKTQQELSSLVAIAG